MYPGKPSTTSNVWQSNTFRLVLIGALTLVLLIPLLLVQNLVRERKERQQEVINEIDSKWGCEVFFYGPILKIPYKVYSDKNKNAFETQYAYFFPEELKNTSNVKTEVKKRNNYESVVFNASMDFTGSYVAPNFIAKGIPNEDISWDKATILIRTTNLARITLLNLSMSKKTTRIITMRMIVRLMRWHRSKQALSTIRSFWLILRLVLRCSTTVVRK